MKKLALVLSVVAVTTCIGFSSFAREWKSDQNGWKYDNGDGSFPRNCWQWIDGDGDRVAECYYFDNDGYCLMGSVTPDNYNVDSKGAWVIDGAVQHKVITDNAPSVHQENSRTVNVNNGVSSHKTLKEVRDLLINDYQNKNGGSGNYVVFDEEMEENGSTYSFIV